MDEKTIVSGKVLDIVALVDAEGIAYKEVLLKTIRDNGKPNSQYIKDYNPDEKYDVGDNAEIIVFKKMFKSGNGNMVTLYNNKFMYYQIKRDKVKN